MPENVEHKRIFEMKTDLSRILSVSGQHGLYYYVAQSRNGVIVEALSDRKRTCFDMKSRVTTLADISIYTAEGELKLKEVFLKLKEVLADAEAPSQKASAEEFKSLFAKAVHDYDADRFYVSHMKKIASWYNELRSFASFDFADENADETAEAENAAEATSQDKANE